MTQEDTILRLQNVSRLYQQGDETIRALDSVSLTLRRGEFVAIAGPSGSGKTTLLNVSVGLDQPTEGKVWVGGQDLTGMSAPELAQLRLKEVGFIFQSYNLVPVLNAEENAELILLLRGLPAVDRKRSVLQVLKEVGLEGLENRRPSELSAGQQQRVAVARAIVAKPALVLADEPTANLDSETAFALMELMEKLNQEHDTTFLFSTHDPRVMKRAKRIIHLVDGHVEKDES
ncbi:MAG: ABC transporter ATP-binding protein [Acidobacteria bacterium]|nr:ABC transporter ATP-binding protein [Acidobacteriota bacterium]